MAITPRPAGVPERPVLDGLEEKWSGRWEEQRSHAFDRARAGTRAQVFAIDTPPLPTGEPPHIRHLFPYTRTDVVARFQRMRGKEVFHPVGWDGHGPAAEHRVRSHLGVCHEPAGTTGDHDTVPLPHDPAAGPDHPVTAVTRRTFAELHQQLADEGRRAHLQVWRRIGLSVDFTRAYRTDDATSRAAAQLAFLRDLARGEAYQSEAPTLWDTTLRTAVGPAEYAERERPAALHRLLFRCADGSTVTVGTLRPELLPACVALVVHPDDQRHRHLIGQTVHTPVFDVAVPVHAHRLAVPDQGTGVAMVCTFGAGADVICWRELQLPTRQVIGADGRFTAVPPPGVHTPSARAAYARLAGATVAIARDRTVALLRAAGALTGAPQPLTHTVKCCTATDEPLEIVLTRQWYLRTGSPGTDLRGRLLRRGTELGWHPPRMRVRYENEAGGPGDWLISRQWVLGTALPVWYPLDADTRPDRTRPLVPDEAALPVDPGSQPPPGYGAEQRGVPGGFCADGADRALLATAAGALAALRRARSAAHLAPHAPLAGAVVRAPRPVVDRLAPIVTDLGAASRLGTVDLVVAPQGGATGAGPAAARAGGGRGLTVELRP